MFSVAAEEGIEKERMRRDEGIVDIWVTLHSKITILL